MKNAPNKASEQSVDTLTACAQNNAAQLYSPIKTTGLMKNAPQLLLLFTLFALLTAGCIEISVGIDATPSPEPTVITYFITAKPSAEFKRLKLNMEALEAHTPNAQTRTAPIDIGAQTVELRLFGNPAPVFLGTAPMDADLIKDFEFFFSGFELEALDSTVIQSDQPFKNVSNIFTEMHLQGGNRRVTFTIDTDVSVRQSFGETWVWPFIRAEID